MSHDQKEALTRDYVKAQFVSQGTIANIGSHDFDSHNPHAHIMLTIRSVDDKGFGKKQRDWNKRAAIEGHRQAWAEYTNRALERAGLEMRIDHRSLKEQGIEREPQIHLGAQVMEMEAKGIQTRVGDESRRISQVNRDIERREAQGEKVQAEIVAEAKSERLSVQTEATATSDRAAEPRRVSSGEPTYDLDSLREPERTGGVAESANGHKQSMQVNGVAETILSGFDSFDLEQYQVQLAEAQASEPSVEKTPGPIKRQEQPKQRQKKRARERDQGMEL